MIYPGRDPRQGPRRPPGLQPRRPHRRRSSRGRAVEHVLGIWVQADEGASFWAHVCAEPARQGRAGRADRRGGTSRLGAERAGECDGLTGLPEATRGHLAPVRGPDLRGYHLIRSSMRFVPHKGPRGGPPLLPGAPAPRWARRRPLGPWRTSPSPTPGPLPPDGGDVGEGPGRFTPFPELPAHGAPRRVSPTGAGGAPSTNAIESASDQLRKGDQEPRPLLSSDEAAVELLWPADPQQRRTRPRTRQGPGQTRQQTHRPTPSHPRPTHHQLQNKPSPNSPPPTPTGSPPTSNPHTQKK